MPLVVGRTATPTPVSRMLANLHCPRKGLVGPWGHKYPDQGVPGPAIGFLQEALRWWDHWLKDKDTGIMAEPMYRVWMQAYKTPNPLQGEVPGRWWPSPNGPRLGFSRLDSI